MTYWERRAVDAIGRMESAVNGAIPELVQSFEAARKDLTDAVYGFYGRYAANNAVTLAQAQQALSAAELRNFRGDLKEYERLAKAAIGTFNLEVKNLSTQARVSRLQALTTQCDAILQKLYQEQKAQIEGTASDVYTEEYYRRLFDIEQFTGAQFSVNADAVNTDAIVKALAQPVLGADISTRLWRQDIDTGFRIRQTLIQMFVTGKPPQAFAADLAKIIGNVKTNPDGTPGGGGKKYEAYRLLYNEAAHVTNQAQLQAYRDDGIDEYENIATLDKDTCDICAAQDGQHYPVDKAVEGENHPSFHLSCRCTTAPYIANLHDLSTTRAARDPETGKTASTSASTYDDWAAQNGILRENGSGMIDTQADHAIIGSEDYRDKFDVFKANKANSALCRETRRIVRQNSGTVNEAVSILDGDGNVISKQRLGSYGGAVNLDTLEGLPENSVVITHNHPKSTSFSDDDIALLLNSPQIRTLIAAGHNGTVYKLTVGQGTRPSVDSQTGRNAVYAEYSRLLSQTGGDIGKVVKALAQKYKWEYEVI